MRVQGIQRARRVDPYPATWEVPLGIVAGSLAATLLALHLARAVANWLTGGRWELTPVAEWITAVPGIVSGDAGAGLKDPVDVAGPVLLWLLIVVHELATVAALVVVGIWSWRRFKPAVLGVASAEETEQMLGLSRLRANAGIIRPDLYGGRR